MADVAETNNATPEDTEVKLEGENEDKAAAEEPIEEVNEEVEEPGLLKKPSYYNADHTTEELQEQKMGRIISSTSEFDGIE